MQPYPTLQTQTSRSTAALWLWACSSPDVSIYSSSWNSWAKCDCPDASHWHHVPHTHTYCAYRELPLMSKASLHDSEAQPGEASLFIWLHALAADTVSTARMRKMKKKWSEKEPWTQWPIYSTVLHSSVQETVSQPHLPGSSLCWPWIRPWVRWHQGSLTIHIVQRAIRRLI